MSTEIQLVHSILEGFLSHDKEIRTKSQEKFNELTQKLQELILCLSQISCESQHKQVKLFSLVAIRKLLDIESDKKVESKWITFNEEFKNLIKSNLYKLLISNTDLTLNNKIADTISMVAANIYSNKEKWEELTNYIFEVLNQSSNADDIANKSSLFENAVFISKHLFILIPSEMLKNLSLIVSAFGNFYKTENLSLRAKTTETIANIVDNLSGKEKVQFKSMAINILETTLKCAENPKEESNLLICLTSLSDISVMYPLMLKKHFNDLFILMGRIVEKKDFLDENIRELSLEIIVTLVEKYPSLLSKNMENSKTLIELIFKYANEIEDSVSAEWLSPKLKNNDELIEEEKLEASITFISRLTATFKSDNKFFSLVADIVMLYLSNESHWKYKYIGYSTVSRMAQDVDDLEDLTAIINRIFADLDNEHPKIKAACLYCIDSFAEDFNPVFQKYHHKTIVPKCIALFKDPTIRIKLEALFAMELFFTDIDDEISLIYVENILNEVLQSLMKDNLPENVIEAMFGMVEKLALTCGKEFAPFSTKCMEIFTNFLSNIYKANTHKEIYGPLLNTICVIGSLSEESFLKFLPDITDFMIQMQNNVTDYNDLSLFHLQKAWNNIAFLVFDHFPDKINGIVSSCVSTLSKDPKIKISDKNSKEFDLQELFNSANETSKIKKQKIDLNTGETADLSESLNLLSIFVQGFKDKFSPFVDQTEQKAISLLKYEISSEVRISAAYLAKDLLKNISKFSTKEILHQKAKFYISEVFTALESEADFEVIDVFLQILKKLFKTTKLFLSVTEINSFFVKLFLIFNNVEASRIELIGKRDETENDFTDAVIKKQSSKKKSELDENGDPIEEDGIELQDDLDKIENDITKVENILSGFSSIYSTIFQFHKELCLEVVNKLISEYLPKYLAEGSSIFDKKMGIFILDDIAEFLGQSIVPNIWDEIITTLIKFSSNKMCVLRQAAVYGIGGFAQFTSSNYEKYRDDSLKALLYAIDLQNKEEEDELEWNHARDNAIASLGKIIKYQGHILDLNLWVPKWLSYIPLKYDFKEAIQQNELLCDILLSKPELLIGENNVNLSNIIRILAKVYESRFSEEAVDKKIKTIATNIKNNPEFLPFLKEAAETAKKNIKTKIEKLFG